MIDLIKCGFNDKHPSNFQIFRPHGSGNYLILLLHSDGFFQLNDKLSGKAVEVFVPSHSIFIYKKGTPQIYGGHELPYTDDWIHFDFSGENNFESLFEGIPIETPIPVSSPAYFGRIFQQIVSEYYTDSIYRDDVLSNLFKILLLKIREQILLPTNSVQTHKLYQLLSRIRNEMRSAPNSFHSVNEAAAKASITVSYFQHLYKEFFKTSFITELIKARTEFSKYYLSGTKLPVRNIAELCGYDNEVHYMRQFKKAEKMTPSEYRKRYFTGI